MAEGSTARQYLIMVLIFSACLVAGFTLLGDSLPTLGSADYSTYNTTYYNKFSEFKNNSDTITNAIKSSNPQEGAFGVLNGFIKSSWAAIRGTYTSFSLLTDLVGEMSSGALGIPTPPTWFTGLLITLIGIGITFALIGAWFQWHI